MIKVIAIVAGGGFGSLARYAVAVGAEKLTPVNFPLGTFIANLLGCFFIGFFWSYFDRVHISNEFRLFVFTGFLGGFTTFSTFARETEQFFKTGQLTQGIVYLLLSNILGLALVALGFILCHRLTRI